MKKTIIKWGACALALMIAMVFAGCEGPRGPVGPTGPGGWVPRTPVRDGVHTTTGWGYSIAVPVSVTTTFVNNRIARIQIGTGHNESAIEIGNVESRLLPRIIETQSLAVDVVAGATFTSFGVIEAVEAAIGLAGGDPDEWHEIVPMPGGEGILDNNGDWFDVIVVGLGPAGIPAYIRAAELGASVIGIERNASVGGQGIHAAGSFHVSGVGTNTRENFRNWWYERTVTHFGGIPAYYSTRAGSDYIHRGSPKFSIVDRFLDESNNTINWLQSTARWVFGGDFGTWRALDGAQRPIFFPASLDMARDRDPRNRVVNELEARELIIVGDEILGVIAHHRPTNRTYRVYGRTIILSSGGFFGDPAMQQRYFGQGQVFNYTAWSSGHGIRMGLQAGAGTYNIEIAANMGANPVPTLLRRDVHPFVHNGVDLSRVPAAGPARTQDIQWKATILGLLRRGTFATAANVPSDSFAIALRNTSWAQHNNSGAAGGRFGNETAAFAMGTWGGTGIIARNWEVGGVHAVIYSQALLNQLADDPDLMPFNIPAVATGLYNVSFPPGSAVTQRPITRSLLEDILNAGAAAPNPNVIRGSNLSDFVANLRAAGFPDVTEAEFLATVNAHNAFVNGTAAEPDRFGRTSWTGPAIDVNQGFTAILAGVITTGSLGGLDINSNMQVLRRTVVNHAEGAMSHAAQYVYGPIPGLYAAGTEAIGVLFNYRGAHPMILGIGMGWTHTSGRLAAEHAVSILPYR